MWEISQPVTITLLTSMIYLRMPLSELGDNGPVDLTTAFGSANLTVNGQKVSSNVVFFLPDRQHHLPRVSVNAEITRTGSGFDV